MVEGVLIESLLFKGFIENSKDFKVVSENKNSTAFRVKSLENNQTKKWTYLVNFNTGTIRRIIAYMLESRNKIHINKFSYYCNKKNKILLNSATSYFPYPKSYDCYIKIYNHLEMYKKLIDTERGYVPKSPSKMVDTENYHYGITEVCKPHGYDSDSGSSSL